jgi:hypothetical protein
LREAPAVFPIALRHFYFVPWRVFSESDGISFVYRLARGSAGGNCVLPDSPRRIRVRTQLIMKLKLRIDTFAAFASFLFRLSKPLVYVVGSTSIFS